ncbi:ZIP family metal transporter [Nanoarchaeota archaeon]
MVSTLLWIILSTVLVSLIAFVGILSLSIKRKLFDKIVLMLVALSAGALMGGAFLHLIPEAIEKFPDYNVLLLVLIGFVFFFFIEKVLCWRHCHNGKCEVHTFAYMNLIGEGIHNFVDGLIIAGSFVASIPLGISTTIAVALHEIPQEIGDFGVLVHGGFKRGKALLLNFLIALLAVLGGIIGFFLTRAVDNAMVFLLSLAAGGFIYISASDLIPEIRKETDSKKSLLVLLVFLIGICLMFGLKLLNI